MSLSDSSGGRRLTRGWYHWLPLLVVFLADLSSSLIPFARYFSYEFAVINSIYISFLSGFFFLLISGNKPLDRESKKQITLLILLLITAPLFYSIIVSFVYDNCLTLHGLLYYLIIAVPAPLIGLAMAVIVRGTSYAKAKFCIIYFLVLFGWVPELYFYPQIYFYNPILIYFPGTIYDDYIPVDTRMVLYRLFTLIAASVLILIFTKFNASNINKYRGVTDLIILFFYLSTYILYPYIGFASSFTGLQNKASSTIKTNGSEIFLYEQINSVTKEYFTVLSQYHLRELSVNWNVQEAKHSNIFVFSSNKEKKNLFGTAAADVAKPWQKSVFLTKDSYSDNIQHELAHITFAGMTNNILGLPSSYDFSLIEGFATAAVGFYDDYPIEYLAYQFFRYDTNYIRSISENIDFFGISSSAGYIISGAFIKYLHEKYPINLLHRLYETGDFEASLNKKFNLLFSEFYSDVMNSGYNYSEEVASYYFKLSAVLQKYCPRYISHIVNEAERELSYGNYARAEQKYSLAMEKSIDDRAILGMIRVYLGSKNYTGGYKFINELQRKKLTGNLEFYLKILLSDFGYLSLRTDSVNFEYQDLLKLSPNGRFTEMLQLRLILLDELKLNEYLSGQTKEKVSILKALLQRLRQPVLISTLINLDENFQLPDNYFPVGEEIDGVSLNQHTVLNISGYMEKNLRFTEAKTWLNFGIKKLDPVSAAVFLRNLDRIQSIEKLLKRQLES